MSITGSYNTLLGPGAVLPSPAGNHQFVVGGPLITTYFAYSGESVATASGILFSANSFVIGGRTALSASGASTGAAGDALYSAGANAPPYWAAAPAAGTAVRFGTSTAPALASVYTATAAGLTLTLPPPLSGAKTIVKNMSAGALTVVAPVVPVSTTAVVANITIGTGAAAGLIADSATWYQEW